MRGLDTASSYDSLSPGERARRAPECRQNGGTRVVRRQRRHIRSRRGSGKRQRRVQLVSRSAMLDTIESLRAIL